MSLLDRATPGERATLLDLFKRYEAAREERRRCETKAEEAEAELWRARGRAVRQPGAAFAAFQRGERVQPAEVGPSVADLELVTKGASEALKEHRTAEQEAAGAIRAKQTGVLQACCERAAAEYATKAAELERLHADLLGAQNILGQAKFILDPTEFTKLLIPSSRDLAALQGKGHDLDGRGLRTLAGGDRVICDRLASAAAAQIDADLRTLSGGEALPRTVGHDAPVIAKPEPKNTRRAALERAAERTA
jgi:hypothetical protein